MWFEKALTGDHAMQRIMALYNAYGALPGGYAGVRQAAAKLGEHEVQTLMDAVENHRADEGDLAEKAPEYRIPNTAAVNIDRHLENILILSGVLTAG